nr:immunoglobulin heavy chain junction region [Macaca mulatta]
CATSYCAGAICFETSFDYW